MPLSSGDKIGQYEIVSPIGAGGMGEVYRARDSKLKRDVAIKVLPDAFAADPGRLARFTREAEVLASLNHPNIATIFGVEDRALVMELVEGAPPRGPLEFDAAWKIAEQIAAALEYAHDRGIVHRDLKPANVMVNEEGAVKLLDFGLAKAFTGELAQAAANLEHSPTMTMGVTQVGVILGTAAYMSPEQAKGKPVDQRADIWAFGVVFYELLTGDRLFQRDDVADTLAQVLTREPDLGRTPERVRRLLRRCLEKDPKKRLRDIREARHYLDEPAAAPPAVAGGKLRWLPWVLAAAALVMAGAVYWRGNAPSAARIHSYVLPPEQSAFRCLGDTAGPATLSPDGKRLAFAAAADGKVQLWVRPLDSPSAQPLAGTEDAEIPFWSADGRWLGFFADGKLKKVEAAGGTVSVLADAPMPRGAAWNRDDVILFAPNPTGPLASVPAAGGAPATITRLDEKRQELSHRWPSFLPDGKRFLFTSRNKGVFLTRLDSKDAPRRLLEESSNAVYSAGYLLYAHGSTLLARPFDADRGEFTGSPVTLAQNMAGAADSDRGCFTAANGLLAYHSGLEESRFNWIDRAGNRTATMVAPGLWNDLQLSPDGARLATAAADSSGMATAWVYDLVRGSKTRVASTSGTMYVLWSRDGKQLLIGMTREGAYVLIARDVDGSGGEEVLFRSNFEVSPWAWTANGGLVLGVRDPKTGWDIDYLQPAVKGGVRARIAVLHGAGDQLGGALSPNGRWILYSSDDGSGSRAEAFVARFPVATDRRQISTTGANFTRWSRDGKEIFFANRSRLMSAAVRESGDALEIGQPRLVFEMRVDCSVVDAGCFDVSPDGKRFLVMEPSGAAPPVALLQNWPAGLKK